jgi:hypothetical protein
MTKALPTDKPISYRGPHCVSDMKTEGDSSEDEELHKQEQHAVQAMPVEERPALPSPIMAARPYTLTCHYCASRWTLNASSLRH